MEKDKWTLVNSENIRGYDCDAVYTSKMLTCDDMDGIPVININEGTLKAGGRTGGAAHEDTEIYYIVSCKEGMSWVWLDEDAIPTKAGDFIVIPPHTFHWIDNTKSDEPFVIYTFWPHQEQNEVYFVRKDAWGTADGTLDPEYAQKRMGK